MTNKFRLVDINKDVLDFLSIHLKGNELKLFLKLLGLLRDNNLIEINKKELAKSLRIKEKGINEVLTKLVDMDILSFENGLYKVSPSFVWKGDTKNHRRALLNKRMKKSHMSVLK